MIKSLSICAAAFLLVGCNQSYPSMTQAREACTKWLGEDKGVSVTLTDYDYYNQRHRTEDYKVRRCELEKLTQQYLGFYYPTIDDGSFKKENDNKWKARVPPNPERKIVKHFRF